MRRFLIFSRVYDDTGCMGVSFLKSLFWRACLVFCFSSSLLFSNSTRSRTCEVEHLGTWVDLNTLNSFEFSSDCNFVFTGAGCETSGEFFSSSSRRGSLVLNNKMAPGNSTCFSKGEHQCSFKFEKYNLVLTCAPQRSITLVKQVRRSVATFKEIKGNSKTLVLMQKGNADDLRNHLRKLSNENRVEATSALGYNYFYGSRGFPKDYVEALYWNRLAAAKGSHHSKVLVGTQYLYGLGVPKNMNRAEEFFLSAAEENDVVPQKALAGMYLMKPSTKNGENRKKAIYWLTQASKLGDKQAKEFLLSLSPQEVKDIKRFCALFDQQSIGEQRAQQSPVPVAYNSQIANSPTPTIIQIAPLQPQSQSQPQTQTLPTENKNQITPLLESNVYLHQEKTELVSPNRSEVVKSSESFSSPTSHIENNPENVPMDLSRCPASVANSDTAISSGIFWLGGGPTFLGINSSSANFDHWRFLVSFQTNPLTLWEDLRVQAQIDYAMPFNSQVKNISYSKIEGKLHYDIEVSKTVALKPSFSYLRLQFEDSATQLGIVGGQIGLGLGSEIVLPSDWYLQLSGMTLAAGRGSIVSGNQTLNMSVMQSNYTFNLLLQKRNRTPKAYGLGLQIQQISLLDSQQAPINLSQYSAQFFYRF